MLVCVIVRGEEGVVGALHSKPLSSYLNVSITGTDLETSQLHHYERERETCGAGERDRKSLKGGCTPHPTDALPLALGCDARATESIKSRRLTERDHEGPAVCDCDAVGM